MFTKLLARLTASYIAIFSLVFPPALIANPNGGTVIHGDISFSGSGNTLNVNQGSQQGIINWENFSINSNETTNFNLPTQTAAILNRVTGGDISRILGTLNSNGKVFLINQNGVVIGQNGSINTQSFIASTLNINNAKFLEGGDLKFSGKSDATVINLGSITAKGGDVFLIAQKVINKGNIIAKKGDVGLAAGTSVILKESGENRIAVKVSGDNTGNITHSGYIEAAKVELRAAGNNPYALAINHTGITRAMGFKKIGGRVVLSSDGGRTKVGGYIETNKKGSLETSGDSVIIANNFKVDTKNGQWLIDSNRFRVAEANGNISGATLSKQLENNNVYIKTSHEGSRDNGDIIISDDISWASSTNLSAKSSANIRVFNSITSKGKSDISLIAGRGANGSSDFGSGLGSKGGDVIINSGIKTKGSIELIAGNGGNGTKGSKGFYNKSGRNGEAGGSVRVNADLNSKNSEVIIKSGDGGRGGDAYTSIGDERLQRLVVRRDAPESNPQEVVETNFGKANGGNGGDAGAVVINGSITAKNDITINSGNGGDGGIGAKSHTVTFPGLVANQSFATRSLGLPAGHPAGPPVGPPAVISTNRTGNSGSGGNGGNIIINSKLKAKKGAITINSGNGGRGANGADGININNVLSETNLNFPDQLISIFNTIFNLGLGNAGNGGDAGNGGVINISANATANKDITILTGKAGRAGNGGESAGPISSARNGIGGNGANGGNLIISGKVKSQRGNINIDTAAGSKAGRGSSVNEKPQVWLSVLRPTTIGQEKIEINRDGMGGSLVLYNELKTNNGDINVNSSRNIVFHKNGKMVAKNKGNINVVAENNLINNSKSSKILNVKKGKFLVLSNSPDRNVNAFNTGEDFYQFGVGKLNQAKGEGSGLLFRNKLSADVVVGNQKITYGGKVKGSKYELSNFVISDVSTKTQRRVSEKNIRLNTSLLLEVVGNKKIEKSTSGNYVAGKHLNALTVNNKSNMKINSVDNGDLNVKQRELYFRANGLDKVFDGNNSAQVNISADSRIDGDLFSILAAKANFEDETVGSDKYIKALFELSGDDAANYKVVNKNKLFASITEAPKVETGIQEQVQANPDGSGLQGMFNVKMNGLSKGQTGAASGNGGVDKDASMGSEL